MLSEEEQAALDSWRSPCTTYAALRVLADAIDRLYPPGWNDPVTPERLVELGGVPCTFRRDTYEFIGRGEGIRVRLSTGCWWVFDAKGCETALPYCNSPRNMKEARELLVRCGAIKEEK
jgi:hypothetical protein